MLRKAMRLCISKGAFMKLFSSREVSLSKGIDKILDKYSERVEEDVLKSFLERRGSSLDDVL